MFDGIFTSSHPGSCLLADTCRPQCWMFWETGGCRWPGPAWQLHSVSTAGAQHRADRWTRSAAERLSRTCCLSSRHTVNTHDVRARQYQGSVMFVFTSWTIGELQAVHVLNHIFIPHLLSTRSEKKISMSTWMCIIFEVSITYEKHTHPCIANVEKSIVSSDQMQQVRPRAVLKKLQWSRIDTSALHPTVTTLPDENVSLSYSTEVEMIKSTNLWKIRSRLRNIKKKSPCCDKSSVSQLTGWAELGRMAREQIKKIEW